VKRTSPKKFKKTKQFSVAKKFFFFRGYVFGKFSVVDPDLHSFWSAGNFKFFCHQHLGSGSGTELTEIAGSGSALKPLRVHNTGKIHRWLCVFSLKENMMSFKFCDFEDQ
jgi:hypothetical protein